MTHQVSTLAAFAEATLYPGEHPDTQKAQQLLQQALAAAKAEAKQHPNAASAALLGAKAPEIRVYSHPVGCNVAGLACRQQILVSDKYIDAQTVAHELAHCLLRHSDEDEPVLCSRQFRRHYGVLRCQQELEAEQCAVLWAARWGGAAAAC